MPFPVDTSFTTQQALDNRPNCKSTDWESFKDERGRSMVRYRCVVKGSQARFEAEADRQIAWLEKAGKTDLYGRAPSPGVNEDHLKALEKNLTDRQKEASEPSGPTRADRMKQLLQILERDGVTGDLISSDLSREFRNTSILSDYTTLQDEQKRMARATDDAGRAYQKPYLDAARKKYEAELPVAIAEFKSRIDQVAAHDAEKMAEKAADNRESEEYLKKQIYDMRAIISAAPDKRAADKQAIDQEVSARSEKVRNRFAGVVTDEIYLWAIPENGAPQLQSIRVLSTNAAGEVVRDNPSNDLAHSMRLALNR